MSAATHPTSVLYRHEDRQVAEFVEIPDWIDQDIDCSALASIYLGGCGGAPYMPAVTPHLALEVMSEHGSAVLDFLDEVSGGPSLPEPGTYTWDGLAADFLAQAVDLWASMTAEEVADALDSKEEEDSAHV